ncbi:hypothetical protein GCM10007979_38890 [Nocardioides albus]|nr:hypothetical protein GCM10007979_38890 [Nocardioides albus]
MSNLPGTFAQRSAAVGDPPGARAVERRKSTYVTTIRPGGREADRASGRVAGARARCVPVTPPPHPAARTSAQWVGSADLGPAEPSFFAADGFHASPAGYERWAQAICDRVDL